MAGAYEHLIAYLDEHQARYRLIDHPPEGRTEIVSTYRKHPVERAAKCLILMVKRGKKNKTYVLAVIPGDRRVDFGAVKQLLGGTYVAFASSEIAEELAGCALGTVLPFAFDDRLELIADPVLGDYPEVYFNAGRLDRSVALDTADYLRLATPRLEDISTPENEMGGGG